MTRGPQTPDRSPWEYATAALLFLIVVLTW